MEKCPILCHGQGQDGLENSLPSHSLKDTLDFSDFNFQLKKKKGRKLACSKLKMPK